MGNSNRHFSARFQQHGTIVRGIAFGQADWVPLLTEHNAPIDIAFRPVISEYMGMRKVEIHIVDWRPSSNKDIAVQSTSTPHQSSINRPHFSRVANSTLSQ